MNKIMPQTVEQAREQAIQWQQWQASQSLSWGEALEWQDHFSEVAKQFPELAEEFKENGII